MVDEFNFAMRADKGSYQLLLATLATYVLKQCQHWQFTSIERYIVEVIKHARLIQFTQFCVNKAAAQHRDDG